MVLIPALVSSIPGKEPHYSFIILISKINIIRLYPFFVAISVRIPHIVSVKKKSLKKCF